MDTTTSILTPAESALATFGHDGAEHTAFRTDRIRRATGRDEPVARRDLPTVLRDEGVQIR